MKVKQNWFETLSSALNAEGLIDAWGIQMEALNYGEHRRWVWDDGSRHGRLISIYRETDGRYERPVHYAR